MGKAPYYNQFTHDLPKIGDLHPFAFAAKSSIKLLNTYKWYWSAKKSDCCKIQMIIKQC